MHLNAVTPPSVLPRTAPWRVRTTVTGRSLAADGRDRPHVIVRRRMDPDPRSPVVVLAGGTGGAKLARGMLDVAGDDLVVIANTGDDIDLYGAYVAPDPDLVTFWLADRIDARGWGLEGDTFYVMEGLRELGVDTWFALGDRDLAVGLRRRELLD